MPVPQFLSAESVAAMFDTSPATVRRWEKLGKIPPASNINGLRRWQVDALLRYIGETMDDSPSGRGKTTDPDRAAEEAANAARQGREAYTRRRAG